MFGLNTMIRDVTTATGATVQSLAKTVTGTALLAEQAVKRRVSQEADAIKTTAYLASLINDAKEELSSCGFKNASEVKEAVQEFLK